MYSLPRRLTLIAKRSNKSIKIKNIYNPISSYGIMAELDQLIQKASTSKVEVRSGILIVLVSKDCLKYDFLLSFLPSRFKGFYVHESEVTPSSSITVWSPTKLADNQLTRFSYHC
jgi:hypothetical protein